MESLSSDSPASLSPMRANALARRMSVTCSATLFESLLNLDPRLSSVKTSPDSLHLQPSEATSLERTWVSRQISLFAPLQSETFFESWPKAGLMLAGEVWAQKTWEHHTVGNASGVSHGAWATPSADGGQGETAEGTRFVNSKGEDIAPGQKLFREDNGRMVQTNLATQVRQAWQRPRMVPTHKGDQTRRETSNEYWERMNSRPDLEGPKGEPWPTPTAMLASIRSEAAMPNTLSGDVANWATPKAYPSGADFARADREGSGGDDLETQLRKANWPTPRHSENVQDELTMRRVAESRSGSGWPAGVEEGRGATLSTAVAANERNWPSPNAFDSVDDFGKRRESNREDGQGMHSVSLRHMVDEMVQWATPMGWDGRIGYQDRSTGKQGTQVNVETQARNITGDDGRSKHRLNPDWEELLMTWPCGWTDPTKPCAGIWPGHAAGQGTFQYPYEPPRTVHRDHCPNRTKRVSAIGNGVCTATAELAYYLLLTEPVR